MPNWNQVLNEITSLQGAAGQAFDIVRKKYLGQLHAHSGRNVIVYYSGWLSKPSVGGLQINDEDKNGFMMAVHGLDKTKGLDLVLHTPGGAIAATQSIVDYLHKMFQNVIRDFIHQIAMSAGKLIAC
jgi:ClpP class serine protease